MKYFGCSVSAQTFFYILSSKITFWLFGLQHSNLFFPPKKIKTSFFPPKIKKMVVRRSPLLLFSSWLVANLQTLLPLPPYNSGHQWQSLELQNIFYYSVRRKGRPYVIDWPIFFYLLDISAFIRYRKIAFTYSSLVWNCILNECLLGWQSVTFFIY